MAAKRYETAGVASEREAGEMCERAVGLRDGFAGHAVEAKDPQP